MKKAERRYLVNRNTYKEIKKYDHQQMEAFLTKVYKNGYMDGRDSGIAIEDVLATMKQVKGVGPATLKKLSEAMEREFDEKCKEGSGNGAEK
jgi:hypothetical protein